MKQTARRLVTPFSILLGLRAAVKPRELHQQFFQL